MFEDNAFVNDVRRYRRNQRLGTDACCVVCGYRKPEGLKTGPAGLLHDHHVVGRVNDEDLTVRLCQNCHAEATEGHRDAGVELEANDQDLLERVVSFLRGIADFLFRLAEAAWSLAQALSERLEALDAALPEWRAV